MPALNCILCGFVSTQMCLLRKLSGLLLVKPSSVKSVGLLSKGFFTTLPKEPLVIFLAWAKNKWISCKWCGTTTTQGETYTLSYAPKFQLHVWMYTGKGIDFSASQYAQYTIERRTVPVSP
jgi:hypothetical protein